MLWFWHLASAEKDEGEEEAFLNFITSSKGKKKSQKPVPFSAYTTAATNFQCNCLTLAVW